MMKKLILLISLILLCSNTYGGIDAASNGVTSISSMTFTNGAVVTNGPNTNVFFNIPPATITNAPTVNGMLANKLYVDSVMAAGGVANDSTTTNFTLTPTIQGQPILTNSTGGNPVDSGRDVTNNIPMAGYDITDGGTITGTNLVAGTTNVADAIAEVQAFTNAASGFVARIGASTFGTIQHLQDIFHSCGHSSGGIISTGAVGKINISAGTGIIRDSNNDTNTLYFFDWGATNGVDIISNDVCYIGVDYNSGSPVVTTKTSYAWNFQTDFPMGNVVEENGVIHIENAPHKVGDHANFMIQRIFQTMAKERDNRLGGLILGETGTRNITLTAGALWERLQRFEISAIDTSGADTFDSYVGTNLQNSATNQWDNENYDNAGVLTSMSANRYSVQWFYIELDGNLICVYGTAQYTSEALAEAEAAPSTIPLRASVQSKLIGRLIFKKSEATAIAIESVFGTTFSAAVVTDHGNLAGLSDPVDHDYTILIDGTREFSGDQGMGGNSLTNGKPGTAPTDYIIRSQAVLTNHTGDVDINGSLDITGELIAEGTNVIDELTSLSTTAHLKSDPTNQFNVTTYASDPTQPIDGATNGLLENLSANNFRLTDLAAPVNPGDAVPLTFLEGYASPKETGEIRGSDVTQALIATNGFELITNLTIIASIDSKLTLTHSNITTLALMDLLVVTDGSVSCDVNNVDAAGRVHTNGTALSIGFNKEFGLAGIHGSFAGSGMLLNVASGTVFTLEVDANKDNNMNFDALVLRLSEK